MDPEDQTHSIQSPFDKRMNHFTGPCACMKPKHIGTVRLHALAKDSDAIPASTVYDVCTVVRIVYKVVRMYCEMIVDEQPLRFPIDRVTTLSLLPLQRVPKTL